MIGELANVVERVGRSAAALGFGLSSDQEWLARFSRADGAELSVGADPASYPAFSLIARPSPTDGGFAVWLLMRVFDGDLPEGRRVPSLENQLWFLEHQQAAIFTDVDSYRSRYEAISAQA